MDTAQQIFSLLNNLAIPYRAVEHPPVFSMADCEAVDIQPDTAFFKNLFLQNRQGSAYYLLLLAGDKPFKTAQVSKALGVSRLSFGSEAALLRTLGAAPGAVSPLGLMFDAHHEVTLVVDSSLLAQKNVCMHPCVNTASLCMPTAALLGVWLPHTGHAPVVIDIPAG